MNGPALHHDQGQGGLNRTLITDGTIDHGRWLRHHAEGTFVGECRVCGGYLKPRAPDDRGGGRYDYEAECTNGHITTAPGGRVLRRSGRHSEMPGGWFEHRNRALKNGGDAA